MGAKNKRMKMFLPSADEFKASPHWSKNIRVIDAHAEGEVGRVVIGDGFDVPGATMMDKLRHLADVDDSLTRFALFEPRGCAQMTANLLFPPTRPEAQAAFIPLQPDGPHAMSGSNAMCVTTVLLETGILPMKEPFTEVILETPAGLVRTVAACQNGKCKNVTLDMFPSFVEHLDHPLEIEGHGTIHVDVAFGGCYFALVDAREFGFSIVPGEARDLVALGAKIGRAAREQIPVEHPMQGGVNKVEYALFCARDGKNIRNGNVIHPGRMDRSPCGTGTAARLAVMHARGDLKAGIEIQSGSIIGSAFAAEITGAAVVGHRKAVITKLRGRAWIFAVSSIGMDPSDPFQHGYALSDTWGPNA